MSRRPTRAGGLVTLVAVVAVAALAGGLFGHLFTFRNPLREETRDRTGPAVLHSLKDLGEYHGSTGELQVTVDLEKDTRYVPSLIKGERTIYQAVGTVNGVVDLSGLDANSVRITEAGTVVVTVPRAELSKVRLDPKRSKVISRQRGALDRVGAVFSNSPTSEKGLQVAAERKLAVAAKQVGLRSRAEENTSKMLTQLLRSAGAKKVVIRFENPSKPTVTTADPG